MGTAIRSTSVGLLAGALFGVTLVAGCSTGDCTSPQPDLDPKMLARWVRSELEVPPGLRDIQVGSGRLAQIDRRLFLQVSINEADGGRSLGSGEMTVEFPQLEAVGKQIQRRRAPLQSRFFGAVAGMREGGDREFLWRSDLHKPDECDPREGRCRFWLGNQLIQYPPNEDILFRVHLERLCAPRYCVVTQYSIPLDVSHRLVESWCR